MRTVKIEDLPLTTNVAPTDEILVIQNGEVKRALVSTITPLDVSSPSSTSLGSPSYTSSPSSSSSAHSASSSSASSSSSPPSSSDYSSASSSSSGSSSVPSSPSSSVPSSPSSSVPSSPSSSVPSSPSSSVSSEPLWNGLLLNEDLEDLDEDDEPDNWSLVSGTLDTYEMSNGNVKGSGGDVTIAQTLQPASGLTSGIFTVTVNRVDNGTGGCQLKLNTNVLWSGATNQNGQTQNLAWSPAVNNISSFTFEITGTPVYELQVNTGNGAHIISSISIVQD